MAPPTQGSLFIDDVGYFETLAAGFRDARDQAELAKKDFLNAEDGTGYGFGNGEAQSAYDQTFLKMCSAFDNIIASLDGFATRMRATGITYGDAEARNTSLPKRLGPR